MSIRCAACGSKRVMVSDKKEGYSLAKGAAGVALFGAVGAIAGADGKKNTYYHCLECGQVLPNPMSQFLSDSLDMYLADPTLWHNLLDEHKREYKNLEWDIERKEIKEAEDVQLQSDVRKKVIRDEILSYLNHIGTIAEYDELVAKYDKEWFEFSAALEELEESGRLKYENVEGHLYCRLVTDVNEIRCLVLQKRAEELGEQLVDEKYDQFESELLNAIEYGRYYTFDEYKTIMMPIVIDELKSDNQYLPDAFFKAFASKLYAHRVLDFGEDDTLKFVSKEMAKSIIAEEKRVKEEARKATEEQEEKIILNFFNGHLACKYTVTEVQNESTDNLIKSFSNQHLVAILKRMEKKGLLESCIEKKKCYYALPGQLEVMRKNAIYDDAKEKMMALAYDDAINIFNSISGWKDADEKIAFCKQALEKAAAMAEAERLERERQAEIARKEAEERARKRKKNIMIVLPIVCILVAVTAIVTTVVLPAKNRAAVVEKYGESVVSEFEALQIGDTYILGSYEQDNNLSNGSEDIEWQVVDKDGTSVLVVSKYALDYQSYNLGSSATWETSYLRKELNGNFINMAFSPIEKEMLRDTNVFTSDNPEYFTSGGNSTTDKVFLLSIDEVEKYFPEPVERLCVPTDFAKMKDANGYDYSEIACYWWLRTPGQNHSYLAVVWCDAGSISTSGITVLDESKLFVRPAMWIELD